MSISASQSISHSVNSQSIYDPVVKGKLLTKLSKSCDKVVGYKKLFDQVATPLLSALAKKNGELDQFSAESAMEAMYYEGKIGGTTLVRLGVNNLKDSDPDKKILTEWIKKSFFSYFLVLDASLGESIFVRDLWGKKEYLCYEHVGSLEIKSGMYIATRVIPCGDNWQFAGLLTPIPEEIGYVVARSVENNPKLERITEIIHLQTIAGANVDESPKIEDLAMKYPKLATMLIDWNRCKSNPEKFALSHWLGVIKSVATKKDSIAISELLVNMVQAEFNKHAVGVGPGIKEKMLVQSMMSEIKIEEIACLAPSQQDEYLQKLNTTWLDKSQIELGGKTPRQIILKERKELGNPETRIEYKLSINFGNDEILRLHDEALHHQEKGEYWQAIEKYSKVDSSKDNLPEPFRYYGNIGALLSNLGCYDEAIIYLAKALGLNPNYDMAKRNLVILSDPRIRDAQLPGGLRMLWSSTYPHWHGVETAKDLRGLIKWLAKMAAYPVFVPLSILAAKPHQQEWKYSELRGALTNNLSNSRLIKEIIVDLEILGLVDISGKNKLTVTHRGRTTFALMIATSKSLIPFLN